MRRWIAPAVTVGGALVGREVLRRLREKDLRGQVALITGGSRGFGLALARELAQHGCRLVLTARDEQELERAKQSLPDADVLTVPCDVTDHQQIKQLVAQATRHFGQIDILINNAGIIAVGPLQTQTIEDFEYTMNVMFWGPLRATLEVLPQMQQRRSGHIVNISSIGGKVSVPHLVPYGAAKFAAAGLSEGMHAELARDGIHVLTVVPGLMRTGSHLNASFKGQHQLEYLWFSVGASFPFTSIAADAAARQVVAGIRRGDAEIFLGWQAKLLALAQGVAPGTLAEVLALVNRLLPGPGGIGAETASGHESRSDWSNRLAELLRDKGPQDLNQLG